MSQSRSLLTTLSAVVASAIACNGNPIAPNATKIPGVTVQILDGPNTNRTATTGTTGDRFNDASVTLVKSPS